MFPALFRISKARAFSALSAPRVRVFPALLQGTGVLDLIRSGSSGIPGFFRISEAQVFPILSALRARVFSAHFRIIVNARKLQNHDSKAAHPDVYLNHRAEQSPRTVKPAAR